MGSATADSASGLDLVIAVMLLAGGAMVLLGAALVDRDRRRQRSTISPYSAPMLVAYGLGILLYGSSALLDTGPAFLSVSGSALIFLGGVGTAVVAFRHRRRRNGG